MTEPPTDPIRVLLVDDDPLVCTGLRLMFRGVDDLEIVGEVGDGADVPDAVRRLAPDVILMDIKMPVVDGIAATRALTAVHRNITGRAAGHSTANPRRTGYHGTDSAATTRVAHRDATHRDPVVIVLTTFDTDATVIEALRAGAAGFLLKHTPPEEIIAAVRRAAAGEPVLSPSITRKLIDTVTDRGDSRREAARRRFALLSEKEREVAVAVADGLSNAEIAERLYLSLGTVKAHISAALTKLDLTNRIHLALLAHDAGATGEPGA